MIDKFDEIIFYVLCFMTLCAIANLIIQAFEIYDKYLKGVI